MNGVGTLAAAMLGSPFPTTLYVGHAAHKANGARSGYSMLNGIVTVVLCTTGLLPLVLRVIQLAVAGPVIVWFGLVTVGQAFAEVPRQQVIAVALGLVPIVAQWAAGIADVVASSSGKLAAGRSRPPQRRVGIVRIAFARPGSVTNLYALGRDDGSCHRTAVHAGRGLVSRSGCTFGDWRNPCMAPHSLWHRRTYRVVGRT